MTINRFPPTRTTPASKVHALPARSSSPRLRAIEADQRAHRPMSKRVVGVRLDAPRGIDTTRDALRCLRCKYPVCSQRGPCAPKAEAPALPVLRWSGGEEIRVGDVYSLEGGSREYTVVELHQPAVGFVRTNPGSYDRMSGSIALIRRAEAPAPGSGSTVDARTLELSARAGGPAPKAEPARFRVGDRVRCLKDSMTRSYVAGLIYTVTNWVPGHVHTIDERGSTDGWIDSNFAPAEQAKDPIAECLARGISVHRIDREDREAWYAFVPDATQVTGYRVIVHGEHPAAHSAESCALAALDLVGATP